MLSLVCPVYNEADNIGRLLDAVTESLSVPFELVVVYDFDEDTTLPVLKARTDSLRFPVRLVRNSYGRGALNAVKTGLEHCCDSDGVAVIMADLSDRLTDLNLMYDLISSGRYDVVCGSRYMRGGRQAGGPLVKSILSRMAGLSLRLLSDIPTHDATNNFKMYSGRFLGRVRIESVAGFEIGLELVVKAYVDGFRIGEVPTIWMDRVAGESRFRVLEWLPHYLKWYFYAFRRRVVRLQGERVE